MFSFHKQFNIGTSIKLNIGEQLMESNKQINTDRLTKDAMLTRAALSKEQNTEDNGTEEDGRQID